MNENMEKVLKAFGERQLWDDIYMTEGEDREGEHYCIFEDWEGLEKFIALAKEVLGMDPVAMEYEIEEKLETTFVFYDEYTTCNDCGKVVRIAPDSYGWQPDFYTGNNGLVCGDCVRENWEYKEDYISDKINNPKMAVNGVLSEDDLVALGFEKVNTNSYEAGWYEGQNDDPEAIYEELRGLYDEVLFYIDRVGQFDTCFSVWVR